MGKGTGAWRECSDGSKLLSHCQVLPKAPKSMDWADENWGANGPGVGVEGVHMTVFGGQPVWPSALYQLVTARARAGEACD